ncbi:MAG: type II toxin-antitoxin system Phd/YefM family antitoxin [Candidatus Limnocylindria bacterium]
MRGIRRLAVSAVREQLADVLGYVVRRRERIVLTRHGRPLGAIVPMEDLERLHGLEAADEGLLPSGYRASWRRVTESIHRRR